MQGRERKCFTHQERGCYRVFDNFRTKFRCYRIICKQAPLILVVKWETNSRWSILTRDWDELDGEHWYGVVGVLLLHVIPSLGGPVSMINLILLLGFPVKVQESWGLCSWYISVRSHCTRRVYCEQRFATRSKPMSPIHQNTPPHNYTKYTTSPPKQLHSSAYNSYITTTNLDMTQLAICTAFLRLFVTSSYHSTFFSLNSPGS